MSTNQDGEAESLTASVLPRSPTQRLPTLGLEAGLTTRSLGIGLSLAVVISVCNIYFALQTGWGTIMNLPSSLLGFAIAKLLRPVFKTSLTSAENVLISTVACTSGLVCLASGFAGIIPSMEYLMTPTEGAPGYLNLGRLILWSSATSLTGAILSGFLWKQMIMTEDLPFPTARANSVLISLLHGKAPQRRISVESELQEAEAERLLVHNEALNEQVSDETAVYVDEASGSAALFDPENQTQSQEEYGRPLMIALIISAIYTLISYFVPQIRAIPIFGSYVAQHWLWALDPSPAYIGIGAIMGTSTSIYVMIGAFIGWGILAPLCSRAGWTTGPIEDIEHGPKGWVLWIALSILLADALAHIGWLFVEACSPFLINFVRDARKALALPRVHHQVFISPTCFHRREERSQTVIPDGHHNWRLDSPFHSRLTNLLSLTAASIFCILCVKLTFGIVISIPLLILAILLSFITAVMGARCLAETDNLPHEALAKLSQIIFGYLISRSRPNAIMVNLIADSIAEAGTLRTGTTVESFKTADGVGASSRIQLYGSLIGGVFGALVSPMIYRLYTSTNELPSKLFPIPSAYVAILSARLLTGSGLPDMVPQWGGAFGLIFLIMAAARKIVSRNPSSALRHVEKWIPTGTAVAIGMYIPPSFSIPRLFGGLFKWWYLRRHPTHGTLVTFVAAGLVIGEAMTSLLNMALGSVGIPHF